MKHRSVLGAAATASIAVLTGCPGDHTVEWAVELEAAVAAGVPVSGWDDTVVIASLDGRVHAPNPTDGQRFGLARSTEGHPSQTRSSPLTREPYVSMPWSTSDCSAPTTSRSTPGMTGAGWPSLDSSHDRFGRFTR